MPLSVLRPGVALRGRGLDPEHVGFLASLDEALPPVLVRRADLRVIDGMHRVEAARQRGRAFIDVEFFDGTAHEAFLLAVEANARHGLPLSPADRRAAVERILVTHPQLSDRAIARLSGLGAKAVASARRRATAASPQLHTQPAARIGLDGRTRALDATQGRLRAADLMAEDPQASLRTVARLAGISPGTVADVRRRLGNGEGPVTVPAVVRGAGRPPAASSAGAGVAGPPDRSTPGARVPATTATAVTVPVTTPPPPHADGHGRGAALPGPRANLLVERLSRDPSLVLKEDGRRLLRLLHRSAAADWPSLFAAVPPHCGGQVQRLARRYAAEWLEFARQLEAREAAAQEGTRASRAT
ncbi:ParB/RepB/Spo0J family partition protein [Kitasatospora sp. NPDC059160]|uniref:ParB/RepB/Spo0J family partition protein n=1 Tax=Kitasatospora sp. NPDC059160 TaxID=3346748 RepID=UPI0036837180